MTYHPKSDFLHVMIERGFLADCTDMQALDEAMLKGPVPAYIGYDATAKSLHVGHLMNIMVLRWLKRPATSRSRSWGAAQQRWAIRAFARTNVLFSGPNRSTPISRA